MSLDKALVQKCYTTIMQHFIDYGHAPHYTQLAQTLGVSIEEARVHQAEAARIGVGCWLAHGTDNVESWAPFHGMATNYRFTINGEQKWFGQWGLESLAVRWLFPGTEVRIDTSCFHTGEPIVIRMRDEEIIEVSPETAVGHMRVPFSAIRSGEAGIGFAWDGMNLFRSEEDARAWAHFDESSAESIMPVADWAYAFGAPLFRNRMEPDSFARMREDGPTFFKRLAEKGKSGSFWH